MRFEVARPTTHPELTEFIEAGASAGCPICQARCETTFQIGSVVRLLNGFKAGLSGVIVDQEASGYGHSVAVEIDRQFLQGPGSMTLHSNRDLFCQGPPLPPTDWLAPLSTDDLVYIDEVILRSLLKVRTFKETRWNLDAIFLPIQAAWHRRLPIRGKDLIGTFVKHGAPRRAQRLLIDQFNFGVDLLVWSQGRRPIQRRRMPAMSQPCYEPSRRNPELRRLIAKLRGRKV